MPFMPRGSDFALVTARVNEYGQFILRELLENSDSKTHRMLVRKDRVVFLVVVDEGFSISPQLQSRAHDIFVD